MIFRDEITYLIVHIVKNYFQKVLNLVSRTDTDIFFN